MSLDPFITVPMTSRYWLANGRMPKALLAELPPELEVIPELAASPMQEELVAADIEIRDRHIKTIAPRGAAADSRAPVCDLKKGLVWPCFVDMHTHLDKAHIWPRNPNPDGSFTQAITQCNADLKAPWRFKDLWRRMDFALRCSYAHGTRAVRTHLDSLGGAHTFEQAKTSFAVAKELRDAWAGRIDLQFVSLVPMEFYLSDEAPALADLVAEYGGILGGFTYANPQLDAQIDEAFNLAKARGLELDLHVDESLNLDDQALLKVAQAKQRYNFDATVVCGHCCSLSVQPGAIINETLEQVKAAELKIVSLPMCNLYLQNRAVDHTPRYRGVTLLHEMHQKGIPVAIASDNCRDPFYAYGDHDGLEVFTQAVRIGHLDHPYSHWPQAISATPATLMGLKESGYIKVGESADLVLFKARTMNELLSRPQLDRVVIRQGQAIYEPLPDYLELDDLMTRK